MDHAGFRTLDTMQRAARIFEVRDAVVCTQKLYAPRTAFLALRAGIDTTVLVADRHVYAGALHDRTREILAVGLAGFDAIVGTEPALLGPQIPIDGDAGATRD
jgi:SanA protein